jgi:hypothetical protein
MGTPSAKKNNSAMPPSATKMGAPSSTAAASSITPGQTSCCAKGASRRPVAAMAGMPSAASARARQPPASSTKRSVIAANAIGRIASAAATGSQPPMCSGSLVSDRTNWNEAQNNPPETAVDRNATNCFAAGLIFDSAGMPVERSRCLPSREATIAPR